MLSIGRRASVAIEALIFVCLVNVCITIAKDKDLKPVELVAQHLQSIGNSDQLAKTQTRAIAGAVAVRFVQGATGEMQGLGQLVSDGHKLAIIYRFAGQDYRGEYFAYDGKNVTVGRYLPGKISVLAEFLNRFDGILKEGLLGGAFSIAWPLRNLAETQPRLKYSKTNLAGRPAHQLEYRPRRGLSEFRIGLFFDYETFHHIRTEYRLHIPAGIGGGIATEIGVERPDSYYILSEDFADFREVDGMTLPHRYTLGFSSEGQTRTFVANWTLEVKQVEHNGITDALIFKAPE
jgi:hypothetical protein